MNEEQKQEERFWLCVGVILFLLYTPFFWVMHNLDSREHEDTKPKATTIQPSPKPQLPITVSTSGFVSSSSKADSVSQYHNPQENIRLMSLVVTMTIGKNKLLIYLDADGNEIRRRLVDANGNTIRDEFPPFSTSEPTEASELRKSPSD